MSKVWRVKNEAGSVREAPTPQPIDPALGRTDRFTASWGDGLFHCEIAAGSARTAVAKWADKHVPGWNEIAEPDQLFSSEMVAVERARCVSHLVRALNGFNEQTLAIALERIRAGEAAPT